MQLTSALAEAWMHYRLLTVRHAQSATLLENLKVLTQVDINQLFDDQLIDVDERDWLVQILDQSIDAQRQSFNPSPEQSLKP